MKKILATTAMVMLGGAALAADDTTLSDSADNAAQEASEAASAAADTAGKAASEAAEAVENAAENTGEAIEETTDMAEDKADDMTDGTAMPDADATVDAPMATDKFFDSMGMGERTFLASQLIGEYVYTSEIDVDVEARYTEIDQDWNNIGDVGDIVMSADGKTRSVLLDIGGFLGIGEHTVAINMDQLILVNDENDAGDFFVVVKATKDELMNAPEYDYDKVSAWAVRDDM